MMNPADCTEAAMFAAAHNYSVVAYEMKVDDEECVEDEVEMEMLFAA